MCFIAQADLDRAGALLRGQINWRHATIGLKCFSNPSEHVVACYFKSQRDLGFARTLLRGGGIQCFEADVRPTDRYLMERFIQGTVTVSWAENDAITHHQRYINLINPRMQKADCDPLIKVVSLDIETSVSRAVVLSIAIHGLMDDGQSLNQPLNKVFMIGDEDNEGYLEFVPNEQVLLKRFQTWLTEVDPDVIIGWNIVGFDLRYLQDRCDALAMDLRIGRGDSTISWRKAERGNQRYYAVVPGRVVLDGIELLRTATFHFESFSLDNVAREMLGRGKLIHDVDARAAEIETMFEEDKPALAGYNLEDCVLVREIFDHAGLTDFAVQRSRLTGLEMGRQGGSVAAFDFLYLPRLHRAGLVAPVVEGESGGRSPGGYVLKSVPGIYRDVIVLDFKSLYPSIIRTFQVDPLAMVSPEEDRVPGFNGATFAKNNSILPGIIEELWVARDDAKQRGLKAVSQAIKIIMNSFYGVLGTPGCRFFDLRLVSSITLRGHEILQKTRDLIEAKGYPVIYGDTDSVFVLIENPSNEQSEGRVCDTGHAGADIRRAYVQQTGDELVRYLNDWWREQLAETCGITSKLEIEFETHFERFLMPRIRGSDQGSKKRYAGMVISASGNEELIFKGLETVRSDWTPLAREFQQVLYRKVFLDEAVEDYIESVVASVISGASDGKLVLRRRLRRKLTDYTKNIPPHVKAARLADEARKSAGLALRYQTGGWIEYVMTTAGPEPINHATSSSAGALPGRSSLNTSPLDYEFYIERQLAPVADSILGFRQTSLAEILDRQLDLF